MKEIISQLSAEFERMEKENITLKKELDGLKAKQQTHNLWAASPLSVMLNHRLEAASFSLMARKTPEDMSWRQIKEICDSGLAQMMFRRGSGFTVMCGTCCLTIWWKSSPPWSSTPVRAATTRSRK